MKFSEAEKKVLRKMQSKGGRTTAERLGSKGMSKNGKKGAEARWGTKKDENIDTSTN